MHISGPLTLHQLLNFSKYDLDFWMHIATSYIELAYLNYADSEMRLIQ